MRGLQRGHAAPYPMGLLRSCLSACGEVTERRSSLEVHIEWWGCGGQLESSGTNGSCAAAGLGAPSCHWSQTEAGKRLSLRESPGLAEPLQEQLQSVPNIPPLCGSSGNHQSHRPSRGSPAFVLLLLQVVRSFRGMATTHGDMETLPAPPSLPCCLGLDLSWSASAARSEERAFLGL